jgi:hypothetical protein
VLLNFWPTRGGWPSGPGGTLVIQTTLIDTCLLETPSAENLELGDMFNTNIGESLKESSRMSVDITTQLSRQASHLRCELTFVTRKSMYCPSYAVGAIGALDKTAAGHHMIAGRKEQTTSPKAHAVGGLAGPVFASL